MAEMSRDAVRAELERIAAEATSDQARVSAMRLLLQMMDKDEVVEEAPSAFEGLYSVGNPGRVRSSG